MNKIMAVAFCLLSLFLVMTCLRVMIVEGIRSVHALKRKEPFAEIAYVSYPIGVIVCLAISIIFGWLGYKLFVFYWFSK